MALYTILGANGTIANALIPVLQRKKVDIRLVSRNPKPVSDIETVKADMLKVDQVLDAISGSDVVLLTVGLQYNAKVWATEWPIIMRNVIDACKATGAKLIFFDNAYMYGKTEGVITETSPYKSVSKKGKIRAKIAQMLEKEMQEGSLKAMIARAVDFYGSNVTDKSAPGVYVFSNLKKGKRALWPINEYPFIFSSEKFEKAFDFTPTSYDEGIKQTAEWFMKN